MSLKIRIATVMLSAGVAFYAIVGGFPWDRGATAKGNQWAQLRIFDEVLYRIVKDYVDEPDMERVRTGALRGLAEGLDPYSAYLTPAQVAEFRPVEPGLHEVGGMSLSKYGGYVYVVSVMKGSPAERSGIHEGDIVEYLGKAPTRDMSLYDAEMLLTSQSGPVEMKVFRTGQSIALAFTPGPMAVPTVESKVLEPGVGYLRVPTLAAGKAAEARAALEQLTAKGVRRVVLDLRGCAVGAMEEGAALADLFLDGGVIARKIGRKGVEAGAISARPEGSDFSGPLSVLIDFGTAGAAETAAAALLAAKRAELVGEKSFGAGVELGLFKLRDGGALLLSVAKYAPPSGKPFVEESVTPSVLVETPQTAEIVVPEDDGAADDPAANEDETKPAPKPAPKPVPAEDIQLKRALELLRDAPAAKAA